MNRDNFTPNTINTQESPKRKARGLDIIAYFLCLIVAFGIWAYVTSTEAEEYEYQFTGVVVNLDGVSDLMQDSNLSPISGEGTQITVTVKGSRREISKYSAEDIRAFVDLSSIKSPNKHTLNVNIDLPGNIQLVSAEPSRVTVFVDEMVEKQVPAKVDLIYSAENNVTVLPPVIDDEDAVDGMITVRGPKSVVDSIDHALIKKDIGMISNGMIFHEPFVLINKDGDEVINPYVKTNVNDLSVSVKVTVEKIVPIDALYTKAPDDVYDYSVVWKYDGAIVESVKIVGDPMVVSKYESITIEIKDIASAYNGSVAFPKDIKVYVGESRISTISYSVNRIPVENKS